MNVSTWAMTNGLIQCMGCKGYGKSEHMMWRSLRGTVMPYCTEECYRSDTNPNSIKTNTENGDD